MDTTPKLGLNQPSDVNFDWAAAVNANWDTLDDAVTMAEAPAEGDLIRRGAAGWQYLPKGSDGQLLRLSSGAPSWSNETSWPIAGGSSPSGGYVTREGNTLAYSVDGFNKVFLFESSQWVEHTIPDEGIAVGCTGLTASSDYYLYVYDNAGTLTLDLSTTAPTTQNGVSVKAGATNRLLLARCRTDGSGAIQDTESQRFINNAYNKRPVLLQSYNSTSNWTYNASAWRECNGGTGQVRAEFVADGIYGITVIGGGRMSVRDDMGVLAVGLDSTSSPTGLQGALEEASDAAAIAGTAFFQAELLPTAGYHYVTILESAPSNTLAMYGTANGYGLRALAHILA